MDARKYTRLAKALRKEGVTKLVTQEFTIEIQPEPPTVAAPVRAARQMVDSRNARSVDAFLSARLNGGDA